ncbi:MAG: MBL fold metallo-hydrolase, partial [Betaproteobacteria bacterium]
MKLPESIQVIERGWLSSNNVVLHARTGAVVVD